MAKSQSGSLGTRLRAARLGAGLSQSMLERKSGIPKSMLSRYENDHLLPSVRTLRRLAEATGTAASALFEFDTDPTLLGRELESRGIRFRSPSEVERIADIVAQALEDESAGSVTRRRSG